MNQLLLLADEYSDKVLVKFIAVDEANTKGRWERQTANKDMILYRSLLVQKAQTQIQVILQVTGIHLLVDELLFNVVLGAEALETLKIV